jgi:hypothetical protein
MSPLFGRKKKRATRRAFRASDGVDWGVEVRSPTASNAMVVFHHPDISSTSRNRYAWWISDGPQALDVTARLSAEDVLHALTEDDLSALFRKSMPISSQVPRFEPA